MDRELVYLILNLHSYFIFFKRIQSGWCIFVIEKVSNFRLITYVILTYKVRICLFHFFLVLTCLTAIIVVAKNLNVAPEKAEECPINPAIQKHIPTTNNKKLNIFITILPLKFNLLSIFYHILIIKSSILMTWKSISYFMLYYVFFVDYLLDHTF